MSGVSEENSKPVFEILLKVSIKVCYGTPCGPCGITQSQWAVSCDPLCPEDRGTLLMQPTLRWPRVFQTVINFPVNTPAAGGSEISWIRYYWQQYISITFSLFFPINYVAGDKIMSCLHETVYQQKSLGHITTCNSWHWDWRFNEITNEFLNIDWIID